MSTSGPFAGSVGNAGVCGLGFFGCTLLGPEGPDSGVLDAWFVFAGWVCGGSGGAFDLLVRDVLSVRVGSTVR